MAEEIRIAVDGGELAALDHGGDGRRPVLLVHGSGHNAAAWNAVAARLVPDRRVVAVDLRGHGRSSAGSTGAQQYWRDLAAVTAALGWSRPLLAGHSTGGYAVSAVTAAGLIEASALVVIDGLVLDDRETTAAALAGFRNPEAAAQLEARFGYGRRFDAAGARAYVRNRNDPLEAGADPELARAVAERSLVASGDGFLRRPTTGEIAATTTADPADEVFPGVDVYERIACPMTIVLPADGFYAARRGEVERIVAARPDRRLIDIPGHHNPVMARPDEIAEIIAAAS